MLLNVDVSSMLSILSGVYIHMVSLFFVELLGIGMRCVYFIFYLTMGDH